MKSISHFCHLFAPRSTPPSEAAGRSVWLTLYYPHPAHLVRAATSSSSQSSILPVTPLFFLHLSRLPPGCPSTCPVSPCSSDWTRLPPPRAVIDGGVIVFLSVILKARSWSGLFHHLRSLSAHVHVHFSFFHVRKFETRVRHSLPLFKQSKDLWLVFKLFFKKMQKNLDIQAWTILSYWIKDNNSLELRVPP